MFHLIRFIAFIILISAFSSQGNAQGTPADIRPMLKSLTQAQKLQLQDYLLYLGVQLDDEIQNAYKKVSPSNQANTVRYIELLKQNFKSAPLTTVKWESDTLFFAELTEGTNLIDSFQITNNGLAPYLISEAKTTCDCTILQAPKYPIMPGESAALRIKFDSSGKLGQVSPAIILFDNSTPNKRSILYLKGNIAARKKLRKYPWED